MKLLYELIDFCIYSFVIIIILLFSVSFCCKKIIIAYLQNLVMVSLSFYHVSLYKAVNIFLSTSGTAIH